MAINYDEQIQTLDKLLANAVIRMKEIHQDFMAATTEFMKSWYAELTKQKVTGATKLTKQLGIEKLSKLKAEVSKLQENTPQIVNDLINDVRIWWHMRNEEKVDLHFKDNVSKSLRLIAGKLGPILERYGYITTDPQEPGFWREWDEYGLNRPPNARPYYPHHLNWSDHMKSIIDEYDDLMRDALQYSSELKKLKAEKTQYEVEDLWSKA